MTRIRDLPENRATRRLKDARQTARELKGSAQRVGGANLAYLVSENAGQFDWSGTINNSVNPAYGLLTFDVTLKASRALVPLVDVAMTVFYSANGTTWEEYPFSRGIREMYSGTGPEIWADVALVPGASNAPGEVKYAVQLYGRLNSRVGFKLQAAGTDEVEITVARAS